MKEVLETLAVILFWVAVASAQTSVQPWDGEFGNIPQTEKSISNINKSERGSDPRVLKIGPSTTFLKNGLKIGEVLRCLGKPIALTERQEGDTHFSTAVFSLSGNRVLMAEFEGDNFSPFI